MHADIAGAQEVQSYFGEGSVAQYVLDRSIGEAFLSQFFLQLLQLRLNIIGRAIIDWVNISGVGVMTAPMTNERNITMRI